MTISWYHWDTSDHLTYHKSCLVAFKRPKLTQIKVSFLAIFHYFLAIFDLIFWFELYQILVLVIYWYQWDTPNHSTYPKSWLVAFKTVVECLKLLKNGQNCRRSRLLLTRFNFGWGVLRWVAWTIWSDACLLDQITYVIL